MEDNKIAEYFIIAGLSSNPQPTDDYTEEISSKSVVDKDPIIDVAVINRTLGETPPDGFESINFTPSGYPADLNHGSLRAHEMNLCFKRGRSKPPLTDIG